MKKRLLPALLALVMVLGMLPLTAFAEDSNTRTDEGEGKAEWLNTGHYYTVSEYLADVKLDNVGLDSSTGKVTSLRGLKEAALNLECAKKANENSSEEKKTELAQTIATKETSVFGSVTKLDLSSTEGMTSETNVGFLAPFTNLTELNLSGCTSLANIGALTNCTKLTTLNLSGCTALEDIGALANCTKLTTLDLSNSAIADKTEGGNPVGGVSALASCTALETVDLSGNVGLTRIDGLSNCASLKTLNLTGTKVTSLAPLANCTSMTSLDVSGLTLTSLGNVDQLKNISSLTMTGTKLEATDDNKDSMMAAVKALNAAKPGTGLKLVDTKGQEIELTYQIRFVINDQHGSAQVSAERAKAGDTVTVSKVTAKEGYAFSRFVITHQGTAVTPVNSTADGCTFTMPADDVSIEVVFESTDPDAPPADNILVTLNNGGIFGQQIKIDRLDSTKYYVVQLQKQVGTATCSVAYKLSGDTTQTLNVLPLATGNSYKVQIAVSDSDSNDLADYGEDWIYETTFTG